MDVRPLADDPEIGKSAAHLDGKRAPCRVRDGVHRAELRYFDRELLSHPIGDPVQFVGRLLDRDKRISASDSLGLEIDPGVLLPGASQDLFRVLQAQTMRVHLRLSQIARTEKPMEVAGLRVRGNDLLERRLYFAL